MSRTQAQTQGDTQVDRRNSNQIDSQTPHTCGSHPPLASNQLSGAISTSPNVTANDTIVQPKDTHAHTAQSSSRHNDNHPAASSGHNLSLPSTSRPSFLSPDVPQGGDLNHLTTPPPSSSSSDGSSSSTSPSAPTLSSPQPATRFVNSIWNCWLPQSNRSIAVESIISEPDDLISTRTLTDIKQVDDTSNPEANELRQRRRTRFLRVFHRSLCGIRVGVWVILTVCLALGILETYFLWSHSTRVVDHLLADRFRAECFGEMRGVSGRLSDMLTQQATIADTIATRTTAETTQFIAESKQHTHNIRTTQTTHIQHKETRHIAHVTLASLIVCNIALLPACSCSVLPSALPSLGFPLFSTLHYFERVPPSARSSFESSNGPILGWNVSLGQFVSMPMSHSDDLWPATIRITTNTQCEQKQQQQCTTTYTPTRNHTDTGYALPMYVDLSTLPGLSDHLSQLKSGVNSTVTEPVTVMDYSAPSTTLNDSVDASLPSVAGGARFGAVFSVRRSSALVLDGVLLSTFDLATILTAILAAPNARRDVMERHKDQDQNGYDEINIGGMITDEYIASVVTYTSATDTTKRLYDGWKTNTGTPYTPTTVDEIQGDALSSTWPLSTYFSLRAPLLDWQFQCHRSTSSAMSVMHELVHLRTVVIVVNVVIVFLLVVSFFMLSRLYFAVSLERRMKGDSVRQLHTAIEAAELARDAKSDFMAFLCHELRNPLHAVLNMTDALKETQLDTEQFESVFTIHSSSELMFAVVNDVLDLANMDTGRMKLEVVQIDLYALVHSLVRANNSYAQDRVVKVIGQIDPNVPRYIQADPTRLNQTLSNLLSNAIKFSSKHGEVRLEVELEYDDDYARTDGDASIDLSPDAVIEMMPIQYNRAQDVSMRLLKSVDPTHASAAALSIPSSPQTPSSRRDAISRRSIGSVVDEPLSSRVKHQPPILISDEAPAHTARHRATTHLQMLDDPSSHMRRPSSPMSLASDGRCVSRPIESSPTPVTGRRLHQSGFAIGRIARTTTMQHPQTSNEESRHHSPMSSITHGKIPLPNAIVTPLSTPAWNSRSLAPRGSLNSAVGMSSMLLPASVAGSLASGVTVAGDPVGTVSTPQFAPLASPDSLPSRLLTSSIRPNSRPGTIRTHTRRSTARRPSISQSQSIAFAQRPPSSPAHTHKGGVVRIVFKVVDKGCGIPLESVPALFEPYTQAKRSLTRPHGGTGLGLAIVKRICDLMNATIQVESEVGSGTTFAIATDFTIAPHPSASMAHIMQQLPQQGSTNAQIRYHNFTSLPVASHVNPYQPSVEESQPTVKSNTPTKLPTANEVNPHTEVDASPPPPPLKTQLYDAVDATDTNRNSTQSLSFDVTGRPNSAAPSDPPPFSPRLPTGLLQVILTPIPAEPSIIREETESQLPCSPSITATPAVYRITGDTQTNEMATPTYQFPDGTHLTVAAGLDAHQSGPPSISSAASSPPSLHANRLSSFGSSADSPGSSFRHVDSTPLVPASFPLAFDGVRPALADRSQSEHRLTDLEVPAPQVTITAMSNDTGIRRLQNQNKRSANRLGITNPQAMLLSSPGTLSPSGAVPSSPTSTGASHSASPRDPLNVRIDLLSKSTSLASPSVSVLSPPGTPVTCDTPIALTRPHVLAVDDAAINRRIIHKMLDAHYQIDDAADGLEALNMIKAQPDKYACVIMDLMMPVMSGSESLIAIRAHGLTHLPVIALTANTLHEDIARCMEIGFTAFLAKPARKDVLRSKLSDLILAESNRRIALSQVKEASEATLIPAVAAAAAAAVSSRAHATATVTAAEAGDPLDTTNTTHKESTTDTNKQATPFTLVDRHEPQ